jgi:hypothetical protein
MSLYVDTAEWLPVLLTVLSGDTDNPAEITAAGVEAAAVPGLAVNRDTIGTWWTVTHRASGFALCWAGAFSEATGALLSLAGIDWTRDADLLMADPAVRVAVDGLQVMPGVIPAPHEGG